MKSFFQILTNLSLLIPMALVTITTYSQNCVAEESIYDDFELELIEDSKPKAQKQSSRVTQKTSNSDKVNSLKLDPYKDIVTLQRKYLPKTERFELYGAISYGLNNAFYNNIGVNVSAGYFFTEKFGLELAYQHFIDAERAITKGLEDDVDIETRSLVIPESYYGIALKWAPIYGKMAWLNEQIVHFDFYIAPSIGMTQTGFGNSEMTYGLSLGQNFAISKAVAVRWDLRVGIYEASALDTVSATDDTLVEKTSMTEDVFLSVGLSYFLPEAKYR